MISTRNPRNLLCTNQSSVVGGFHEIFWRWSSLEKTSRKFHTHSSRRDVFQPGIHWRPKRSSTLSNPSSSIHTSAVEPATTPIDSSPETSNNSTYLSKLSLSVRKVMRHVPHPVVLLLCPNHRPRPKEPAGIEGMTISSFTTLTLSPEPIVTFNIKRPSRTLEALQSTIHPDAIASVPNERERCFHIHILQSNPEGANIADHFSRGGPVSSKDLDLVRAKGGSRWDPSTWGLTTSKGIRRTFECEILQEGKGGFIDVGDHTVVFGKVKRVFRKETLKKVHEIPWNGLCYMQGQYQAPTPLFLGQKNKGAAVQKNEVGDKEERLDVEENIVVDDDSMLEGKEKIAES